MAVQTVRAKARALCGKSRILQSPAVIPSNFCTLSLPRGPRAPGLTPTAPRAPGLVTSAPAPAQSTHAMHLAAKSLFSTCSSLDIHSVIVYIYGPAAVCRALY